MAKCLAACALLVAHTSSFSPLLAPPSLSSRARGTLTSSRAGVGAARNGGLGRRAPSPLSAGRRAAPSLLTVQAAPDGMDQLSGHDLFEAVDADGSGHIDLSELTTLLKLLEIDASEEDAAALFRGLDSDGNGEVDEAEFCEWYEGRAAAHLADSQAVHRVLCERTTVNDFDPDHKVSGAILESALRAAVRAPNHRLTEPWRFVSLGKETVAAVAALNAAGIDDEAKAAAKRARWEAVPNWLVVTSRRSDDPLVDEENYAATCCAVQNMQLALWSDGVGAKWTTGPVTRTREFNVLCGVDADVEKVVAVLWFGYPKAGGLDSVKPSPRRKEVDDVYSEMP